MGFFSVDSETHTHTRERGLPEFLCFGVFPHRVSLSNFSVFLISTSDIDGLTYGNKTANKLINMQNCVYYIWNSEMIFQL